MHLHYPNGNPKFWPAFALPGLLQSSLLLLSNYPQHLGTEWSPALDLKVTPTPGVAAFWAWQMTANFMELTVSCWHHLTCCVLNFMSMSPFDEPTSPYTSPYIWQHEDISIIHAFFPMMFFFSSNLTTHPPSSDPSMRCCLHLFGDDLCLLFSFHLPTLQLRCMRCEGHITRFLRLRGKGRGFNFALLPHYLSLLNSVHLFSVFFATNIISPFNYLPLVLFWMGKNPSYMRTNESIFNSSYLYSVRYLHVRSICPQLGSAHCATALDPVSRVLRWLLL